MCNSFVRVGTVQENILFEAPFHADDYEQAIKAANLQADFEQLAAGDQTELGEGVRLPSPSHSELIKQTSSSSPQRREPESGKI